MAKLPLAESKWVLMLKVGAKRSLREICGGSRYSPNRTFCNFSSRQRSLLASADGFQSLNSIRAPFQTLKPTFRRAGYRNVGNIKMELGERIEASSSSDSFRVTGSISEIHDLRRRALCSNKIIAFVPTMGALHEGHIDLIKRASRMGDEVWVSIFVNPAQFGPTEDLNTYPQNLRQDCEKIEAFNASGDCISPVTLIFTPTPKVMYPHGLTDLAHLTMPESWTQVLEGAARPTFFRGVTTVVMKLLNVIQPDIAVFGQKDIQQFLILRRMVEEFLVPTVLEMVPTAREQDGLALSSRNVYLGSRRRTVAPLLSAALQAACNAYQRGSQNQPDILRAALDVFDAQQDAQRALPAGSRVKLRVDYISIRDPKTFKEPDFIREDQPFVLTGAMVLLPIEEPQPGEHLGSGGDIKPIRLIDNYLLGNWGPNTPSVRRLSG